MRFNVHHHYDPDELKKATERMGVLTMYMARVLKNQEKIMAVLDDLKTALAGLGTAIDAETKKHADDVAAALAQVQASVSSATDLAAANAAVADAVAQINGLTAKLQGNVTAATQPAVAAATAAADAAPAAPAA